MKPNYICIRIRSFLESRIIFVFVFGRQNTIRSPLVWPSLARLQGFCLAWVFSSFYVVDLNLLFLLVLAWEPRLSCSRPLLGFLAHSHLAWERGVEGRKEEGHNPNPLAHTHTQTLPEQPELRLPLLLSRLPLLWLRLTLHSIWVNCKISNVWVKWER